MTELIEKNIKVEYLKRYYQKIRKRELELYDMKRGHGNGWEQIKESKELSKLHTVVWSVDNKIRELENQILNLALKEIGEEPIPEDDFRLE